MSGVTQVIINAQTTQAQITSSGVDVSLVSSGLTETIIGVPGVDGVPGPQGDSGAGILAGGSVGQVPLKQSATDYDLGWSDDFTIDPDTGNVGIGGAPYATARLLVKADDSISNYEYAMLVRNADNTVLFSIAESGETRFIQNAIRVTSSGGVALAGLNFSSSGSTIYLNAYSSQEDMRFFLYNSAGGRKVDFILGDGRLEVRGTDDSYFDGSLGIGTRTPSTKLHVEGPVRVGSYTVATVPSASSVGAGAMIYVNDEIDGAVMAFSDDTDWRRMTDRVVIS